MKKTLFISLLLASLSAHSQVRRIFGSSYFDIRTHKFGWIGGVNGTDTLARWEDTTHLNWLKPIRLARWDVAGRPSTAVTGYFGYNTDSNRVEWYNGTSWQQPGTGGSGGGGAPGGSSTEPQYRVDATTFGGMAGKVWDNTNRGLTHTIDALGVTQTTTGGYILQNTTAAAAGAQQISPPIYFKGFGWKTAATAASQSVDFRMYNLPIQGSANPLGSLLIQSNINGAGYLSNLEIRSDNSLRIGSSATAGILYLTSSTSNNLLSAGNRFDFIMNNAMSARASGTWTVVSGTTVSDPNTFTGALWNSISTTLPQLNAAYNTTNYTLLGTGSTGNFTIDPTGGNVISDGKVTISGNRNFDGTTASTYGTSLKTAAATFTDNVTAASGTTNFVAVHLEQPTLSATNASVTATAPTTLRVEAPLTGTNMTITIPYSIAAFGGGAWFNGAIKVPIGAGNHNGVAGYTQNVITCDASSANHNSILPDAANYAGFSFTFKRIDNSGNTCTVTRGGSSTIDGATTYSLTAQYKYVKVISDGTNWLVIANN